MVRRLSRLVGTLQKPPCSTEASRQGTKPEPTFLRSLKNNGLKTLPFLLVASLAGCMSSGTATALRTVCAPYGDPITYSGTKDTNETRRQIDEKNKTYQNLGCF